MLYGSNKKLGRKDAGWNEIHRVTNDTVLKDKDYTN